MREPHRAGARAPGRLRLWRAARHAEREGGAPQLHHTPQCRPALPPPHTPLHTRRPLVSQLAGTAAAPHLELLKLFAWGTWTDYKGACPRPALHRADPPRAACPRVRTACALRVHVLPIVLPPVARCTLHAPLSRASLTRLSHAPLPRASPTQLSHAPLAPAAQARPRSYPRCRRRR